MSERSEQQYDEIIGKLNQLLVIIAFNLYQPCGSFYHSLQQNLPYFAEEFTSMSRAI